MIYRSLQLRSKLIYVFQSSLSNTFVGDIVQLAYLMPYSITVKPLANGSDKT